MKANPTWTRAATAAAAVAIVSAASMALADTPTTPSNLDPDSFGRNMVFLGLVNTPPVYFVGSCDEPDMALPNRCIELNGSPGDTAFEFPDLASISIPPQSTTTIIWPVLIQNASWRLFNNTGGATTGMFRTNVILTIESDVLNDPSAMCPDPNPDPNVEEPPPIACNGRFVATFPLAYGETVPLAAGERTSKRVRAASAGIGAFDTGVFTGLNLTPKLIKKLFASPMTIRVGLSGRVQLVDPGALSSFLVGVRLVGDR